MNPIDSLPTPPSGQEAKPETAFGPTDVGVRGAYAQVDGNETQTSPQPDTTPLPAESIPVETDAVCETFEAPRPSDPASASQETIRTPLVATLAPPKSGLLIELYRRAAWQDTSPNLVLRDDSETADALRAQGWSLRPLRALLYWDFNTWPEPVRALKEDWRDLWVGAVHGRLVGPNDPCVQKAATALGISIQDKACDTVALAYDANERPVGMAVLARTEGVWRDMMWTVTNAEAERVLLAAALRAARDKRAAIALGATHVPLAIERGAVWMWEWTAVRNGRAPWAAMDLMAARIAARITTAKLPKASV